MNKEFSFNIPQPSLEKAKEIQKDMAALNAQLEAQLQAELEKDEADQNQELINEIRSKLNIAGGRRHRGSKKAHKGKRHGNASLRAWVTFVKKVQKEEGVGYKEAMTLAKKRKDKGEKWRGGGDDEYVPSDDDAEYEGEGGDGENIPQQEMMGGRRRRRRTRRSRGSKKRRGTRRRSHRRSRRHH